MKKITTLFILIFILIFIPIKAITFKPNIINPFRDNNISCGNNICEEPYEKLSNCPEDCVKLSVFFDSTVNKEEARNILKQFDEKMVGWIEMLRVGTVYVDRLKSDRLIKKMNNHKKILHIDSTKKYNKTIVILNYKLNNSFCYPKGYLNGSIYKTFWKYGGYVKLEGYTICFSHFFRNNNLYIYIAKPANIIFGNINVYDSLDYLGIPYGFGEVGYIEPFAKATEVCFDPYVMSDDILIDTIQGIIKQYLNCSYSSLSLTP